MRVPTQADVKRLLRWRPRHGVVSAYVDLHPEERGDRWRIELRNAAAAAVEAHASGDRDPLAATVERVRRRLEDAAGDPSGRTQIGFAEVARKPGREEWFSVQAPHEPTEIVHDRRPVLHPLVALLDEGQPHGVALVSAERVRLLCWTLGGTEELESWGLEIFSLDWRERKSKVSGDTARVQGARGSGRDQFGQRLEANRERFLAESARLVADRLHERRCGALIVFADPEHAAPFAAAGDDSLAVAAVEHENLIGEPADRIADRVVRLVRELNRRRELELVERVEQEARGGTRGALGADEMLLALAEGRVEHLLLDPRRGFAPPRREVAAALAAAGAEPVGAGGDLTERMVELAFETGARVTPVDEEAAEALAEVGGVAALLRY